MAAFGWDFLFIFVWTATTPPRRCHGSCLLAKGKSKSFISPGSSRIRAGPRSNFSQAVNQHLAPSLPLPPQHTYCLFCVIIVSLYWFMRRIDAEGAESNSFGFRERACKSVLLCDVWDYFCTHTHTPLVWPHWDTGFFSQACSCWVCCCCCFLVVQIQTIKFTHRDIDSEDVEEHFFGKKDDYNEENPGTLRNRIKRKSSMSLLLDDHPAQWVVLHSPGPTNPPSREMLNHLSRIYRPTVIIDTALKCGKLWRGCKTVEMERSEPGRIGKRNRPLLFTYVIGCSVVGLLQSHRVVGMLVKLVKSQGGMKSGTTARAILQSFNQHQHCRAAVRDCCDVFGLCCILVCPSRRWWSVSLLAFCGAYC